MNEVDLKLYEIWSNDLKKYDQIIWVNTVTLILSSITLFLKFNRSEGLVIFVLFLNIFLVVLFLKHSKYQKEIRDRIRELEAKNGIDGFQGNIFTNTNILVFIYPFLVINFLLLYLVSLNLLCPETKKLLLFIFESIS